MGYCVSISLQSSLSDSVVSRCFEFTTRRARYVCRLEENLDALKKALEDLTATKNDLERRVNVAEQEQQKRLDVVQIWISRVEAIEAEVNQQILPKSTEEISKLCFWGCCSNNYSSSYKFGKRVFEKLAEATDLLKKGVFEVVAERVPIASVVEMPFEPTVGLELLSEEVWRDLSDENVGIMGLYGMGGVGKTTLLKIINNNFLHSPNNHYVIWVVVSKDHQLVNIQNDIGEKIGYSDDAWKKRNHHQKAKDIFSVFNKRRFVLLLDDVWERVDLVEVGVPLPDRQNGSKLVFTSRSKDVCCRMDADKMVEVKCLSWEKSWKLFQERVGEKALNSHQDIPNLAEIVAKECGGLPLAINTIGRAMACKTTPQEWKHAIQVLKNSAANFSGMGDKVFPVLKFSYDNLSSEKVRSCFLYCALFPEDWHIRRKELINYWIYEGLLDEYADRTSAENHGYDIIGSLLYACLLEDDTKWSVKMHDVIRDMALWIACESVRPLFKLPTVDKLNEVRRMYLIHDKNIESLSETPTCPNLLTFLLSGNWNLRHITDTFFDFMPKLRVLDMSDNIRLASLPGGISKLVLLQYLNLSWTEIEELPRGISELVSLQHLDLSWTKIEELPRELSNLVLLKYLNLNYTEKLGTIPQEVISSLSQLQVLGMFYCGASEKIGKDSVQCEVNESLVKEVQHLKHLNELGVSIQSVTAFERFLSFENLVGCTRRLLLRSLCGLHFLNMSSFFYIKLLEELAISYCTSLEELKIDWALKRIESQVISCEGRFLRLSRVTIEHCHKLKDLTWLIFAPNLDFLQVSDCFEIEEIICLNKLSCAPEVTIHPEPLVKLSYICLYNLPKLKNIYLKPLPFRCLKLIVVRECAELKKLPINSNGTNEPKLTIRGEELWWNGLEWEDEATRHAFLPCFRAAPV